ncbi:hypothetical protein LTR86_006801 [Recurvomyces mirabilis]|nr:hypothetical protein LTR86_006801 [Recurvomyces mirabilis]
MSLPHDIPLAKSTIEMALGYSFNDDTLLEEALLALPTGVNGRWIPEYNKRLAMMGDAALRLLITNDCYCKGMLKARSIKSSSASSGEHCSFVPARTVLWFGALHDVGALGKKQEKEDDHAASIESMKGV